MRYENYYNFIHDSLRDLPDFKPGDLDLAEEMADTKNIYDFAAVKDSKEDFTKILIQKRNTLREKQLANSKLSVR